MLLPNVILSGAKYGRTVDGVDSFALHVTVCGGHTGRGHGAAGGHDCWGGHVTVGQRGRGHGGHSPASFLQLLLSMITGCCLGMLDFRTYLLRSGTGGHSVLSM